MTLRSVEAQVDSLRLTRTEAVQRALSNTPELARRMATRDEARRLERVPYPSNPEVSVEFEGSPSPWSSRGYTRRVVLEQVLDLRGERRARSGVGRATGMLADRELGEREQEIAAEVDQAYSRHLLALRKTAFLDPLRERAHSLRGKAESARRRETLSGFDARLLRAEALGLEADWVEARRELDVASSDLRVWLALSSSAALTLEDDLDELPWRCESDSAVSLAVRSRRALARATAAESLSRMRLRLEQRLGQVNPKVGVSVARDRLELEPEGGGLLTDVSTSVGLGVTLPIPLFGLNSTGIAEARVELERARAERAALERQVRQSVTATCAALDRAEEERRLRSEAAASTTEDLKLVESAYADGRIPLEEFLILRERLVRQQLALIDATRSVEAERTGLVRATGVTRAELKRRWGGTR